MHRWQGALAVGAVTVPIMAAQAHVPGEAGLAAFWVSRVAAIAAFTLLTAATATGLLISNRETVLGLPRKTVYRLHQGASALSILAIALHVEALLFDSTSTLSDVQLAIPFAPPVRAFAPTAGVLSMWVTVLVFASFYARDRIGRTAWRFTHYASFAGYGLGFAHGVAAGPDSDRLPLFLVYCASGVLVAGLLCRRIVTARTMRPAKRARPVARPLATGPALATSVPVERQRLQARTGGREWSPTSSTPQTTTRRSRGSTGFWLAGIAVLLPVAIGVGRQFARGGRSSARPSRQHKSRVPAN